MIKPRKVMVMIELLTDASIKELKDCYKAAVPVSFDYTAEVKQVQANVIKEEKKK